jgi:hypothetical protein
MGDDDVVATDIPRPSAWRIGRSGLSFSGCARAAPISGYGRWPIAGGFPASGFSAYLMVFLVSLSSPKLVLIMDFLQVRRIGVEAGRMLLAQVVAAVG